MGSRWLSRLAVAAAAAGALTLIAATSALADTQISINPKQVPTTADKFGGDDCTGPFANLPDDQDGWHFVLPAASGDSFTSLTLTFTNLSGGTVTVTITSTDPQNPSTGSGWSGYIDNAGSSGADKHAYVFTDAGWTLTGGTAMVTGDTGVHPQFVLSHTCAGTPSEESPSPTPSESESTPSNGSSTPGGGGSTTGGGGGLPVTGSAVGGIVVVGIGLLAAGVALMAVRRRRDLSDLTEV
jgi:LPXTG-motif cell wall-anchored protein